MELLLLSKLNSGDTNRSIKYKPGMSLLDIVKGTKPTFNSPNQHIDEFIFDQCIKDHLNTLIIPLTKKMLDFDRKISEV